MKRVALTLAVSTLVACSSGAGGATTGQLSGDEPAPEASRPAAFGRPAAVGDLRLTLSDRRPGGDDVPDPAADEAGTVEFTARSENPTVRGARNPDVAVYCADGRHGSWFAVSRWEPGAGLPAHSFMEGRLVLGVPLDCAAPEVRAADYHRHWEIDASWALRPQARAPDPWTP